ncbi:MAG TPA: protein kinase [Janthinobacterium sp.]|nr:protein kinase [Janthinobacterium sp.]
MTSQMTINSIATGVPGLDDVLGGGLPELSFNLIFGQPGCGKTILAHQIMFSVATPERSALYITVLAEPPLKMLRNQQQFEFFDVDMINRSVRFVNLTEEALADDLDKLLSRLAAEVQTHAPAFIFIDSFRSMMLASTADNKMQKFLQHLAALMTSWQATTFLIGEYLNETDAGTNPVFAVADGLICLRQSVQRNSVVRKMEILKMRAKPSLPGLHSFRIGASGIKVFAPAFATIGQASSGVDELPDTRLRMGVPLLDEMLGGGLPTGYSLLVAGPSGSGKSILAAAFLAEGARCGETGVIAAFEQHPKRSRKRAIADLIESGRIALVDTSALDLSIDEILLLLLNEIRRLKATRVVIDSLSGFELTLAPTFREDFRESMLRLVVSLTTVGVTVLMTSELEDRYTDLRFSPYGTAFLTDAIIVQRYVELGSRLQRVIAVVKVRGSDHSNELRQFSIDGNGIQVGAMLSDQEGLLIGNPMKKSDAN